MRKLVTLLVLFLLTLAACGDGDAPAPADTEPEAEDEAAFTTMEEGVLTVGTELPAPPFWNGDDYDAITDGYEVDIAREIAERLGLDEVAFVEMPFEGLVTGTPCPCDLNFSQVTITDERAEVVDFTAPYFDAHQGVMVAEGTEIADVETARTLQWGGQVNTTGARYLAEELQPEAEPQLYNTVTDLFAALRAGQIDAVMMDTPIVLGEAIKPDSGFEVIWQFETGEQYGAVLEKDSPNTPIVSGIIEELREEGILDELGATYFDDPASVPILE